MSPILQTWKQRLQKGLVTCPVAHGRELGLESRTDPKVHVLLTSFIHSIHVYSGPTLHQALFWALGIHREQKSLPLGHDHSSEAI